jgi:hypothetical protein
VFPFQNCLWTLNFFLAGHIFGREPSNDYYIKILFLLCKWIQTRRFLWEFPIGSYVKLSSAVAAILVGVLRCRLCKLEKKGMKLNKIFSSKTTETISTKLWWNGPWMAPFQNCVRWSRLPTKMAAKLKIIYRLKEKFHRKTRNIC